MQACIKREHTKYSVSCALKECIPKMILSILTVSHSSVPSLETFLSLLLSKHTHRHIYIYTGVYTQ